VRRIFVALFSAIVVGLMLVPSGVSAGSKTVCATDSTGDVGFGWDTTTGDLAGIWGDRTPVVSTKYFDIVSAWLSFDAKTRTYTFEMQLAAALPQPGSALPTGVHFAEWFVVVESSAWNIIFNPNPSTGFKVELTYDGSNYAAELRMGLGNTGEILALLPFTVDGSTLQIEFSADSIGNMENFWWEPWVEIWHPPPESGASGVYSGNIGYFYVDALDFGSNLGQKYFAMPSPA